LGAKGGEERAEREFEREPLTERERESEWGGRERERERQRRYEKRSMHPSLWALGCVRNVCGVEDKEGLCARILKRDRGRLRSRHLTG